MRTTSGMSQIVRLYASMLHTMAHGRRPQTCARSSLPCTTDTRLSRVSYTCIVHVPLSVPCAMCTGMKDVLADLCFSPQDIDMTSAVLMRSAC